MCGQPVLHSSVEQNDQADEAKDRREKTKVILNAFQNMVRNARRLWTAHEAARWAIQATSFILKGRLTLAGAALSSNPHIQRSTG